MNKTQEKLFDYQDLTFRDFNMKLIPNIDKNTVIGVKTQCLKSLAKEIIKSGDFKAFLQELPHRYFEENQLHSFVISKIKDFETAITELERFLPYVDNWATCDQLILKAIAENPEKILPYIEKWIQSEKTYTVRFAIGLLMRYFLDERFENKYLSMAASVKSEEYYINMMSAWYFATALAKQYEKTLPYFEKKLLPVWVHKKAIQKARESRRVTDEHKEVLKALA